MGHLRPSLKDRHMGSLRPVESVYSLNSKLRAVSE